MARSIVNLFLVCALVRSSSSIRIEPSHISVSGISSGADFAVQLQVAFPQTFAGVGVFAGQAYHCAVTRFPKDELKPGTDPSVPICDGCPPNTTLTYDHCKRHPDWTADVKPLVGYARAQSAAGNIDPLQHPQSKKVFLYRGTRDTTYNKGTVNATRNFFQQWGIPAKNIHFESHVESGHLVPGIDPYLCWWEEWSGPDNCTYDGAGHALHWIYGADALANGRDNTSTPAHLNTSFMRGFDQRPFFPSDGRDALLADHGRVFVPEQCRGQGASRCKLHVFLHGCGVTPTYDVFATYAGFNEWAVRNGIVVLYPRMSTRGHTGQEKSGCWDGYGQTGADYALKAGLQMQAVHKMVLSLSK